MAIILCGSYIKHTAVQIQQFQQKTGHFTDQCDLRLYTKTG